MHFFNIIPKQSGLLSVIYIILAIKFTGKKKLYLLQDKFQKGKQKESKPSLIRPLDTSIQRSTFASHSENIRSKL